ncbi:MAG: acetyltransferase, ribosomal protein N-acetylase [Segetibacter sp.]|nr:acetyltransferase, ribosomal protein N-acetylase [Segetibacter sp.]
MKPHIDLTTDYILENEKVLLRPLRMSDLVNLMKFSIEEPELWKYSLLTAAGAENLQKYLKAAERGRSEQKEYAFIVFDKKRNEYAGSTRFYDIQPDYQTVQLGYTWYGKDFQGTGLNKNCKYLLLEHAFEKWQVERVELRADNNNERSIAAMKSIGCTVEGVLRSNMPKREGGRRDSIVLSILKSEWQKGIKEMLKSKM